MSTLYRRAVLRDSPKCIDSITSFTFGHRLPILGAGSEK